MQTSMSRSHSLRAKGLGVGAEGRVGNRGGGQSHWVLKVKIWRKNALVSLARVRGSIIIIITLPEPCPRFTREDIPLTPAFYLPVSPKVR